MSTMSEVQEIFLYLQTHTNLSIIRSLGISEQHLRKKEGKNLLHLLKPISDEFPELRILPIYCSTVNHFNRHFPAAALSDYIKAKELQALNNLIGKTPENKGIKVQMRSRVKEGFIKVMQEPLVDSFDFLKGLALNDTCSIEELESILPEVKAALEKIDLDKHSPSKIMLQKLLEFIEVEEGDESIPFLILHDLLKLLYPYKFTPDVIFLEDGPIFNQNGSMDGEVRRKKIREVKMIMDIPLNR